MTSTRSFRQGNNMPFILIETYGEYEDTVINHLYVSDDKSKLEDKIVELEQSNATICELHREWNELEVDYYQSHPTPEYTAPLPTPKWKRGILAHEITPEMIREREEIATKNALIIARNTELQDEFYEGLYQERLKFFASKGITEEDFIRESPTELKYYRISEIEEL
jgi:hypothetical protein